MVYSFHRFWCRMISFREKGKRKIKLEENHLDCWPSGRLWDGFMVPPDEHATIIFALLSIFDSTPVSMMIPPP